MIPHSVPITAERRSGFWRTFVAWWMTAGLLAGPAFLVSTAPQLVQSRIEAHEVTRWLLLGTVGGTIMGLSIGWILAAIIAWFTAGVHKGDALVNRARLAGLVGVLVIALPLLAITLWLTIWLDVAIEAAGVWMAVSPAIVAALGGWILAPTVATAASRPTHPTSWELVRSDTALTSRGDTLLADDEPGATA